jgi:rhodanese-related sulfurtransferase/uncharacterized membrane protein YedE/YeeE
MGPLIPQGFVNPDLNLFFAFVIGLGFGYVLEQAGFSSSKKLAGVFYGYDFVVLKVFFTAAVTAMTGLLLFNYIGWIDYHLLYINPTFLTAAIVGGAIMGLGFIMGGFCPGTSIVAAVIGKVDAMIFVVGMFIGIFLFGEFYHIFEPVYFGGSMGNIFVFESLGMSREWFALMLIVVALIAFKVTQMIEDNINNIPGSVKSRRPSYLLPTVIAVAAGVLLIVLPPQPRSDWSETGPQTLLKKMAGGEHLVTVDETAYSLMNGDERPMVLVDVRNPDEYNLFSLPGAINIPVDQLLEHRYTQFLESADHRIVFYSNSNTLATEAWLAASRAGISNLLVLEGGLNGFVNTIFYYEPENGSKNMNVINRNKFREKARNYFLSGKAAPDKKSEPVPVIKLIEVEMPPSGGC